MLRSRSPELHRRSPHATNCRRRNDSKSKTRRVFFRRKRGASGWAWIMARSKRISRAHARERSVIKSRPKSTPPQCHSTPVRQIRVASSASTDSHKPARCLNRKPTAIPNAASIPRTRVDGSGTTVGSYYVVGNAVVSNKILIVAAGRKRVLADGASSRRAVDNENVPVVAKSTATPRNPVSNPPMRLASITAPFEALYSPTVSIYASATKRCPALSTATPSGENAPSAVTSLALTTDPFEILNSATAWPS